MAAKSLEAVTAEHGRLVSDLREMQCVVESRCRSRWEPGLGRRRHRAAAGAAGGATGGRGFLDPIASMGAGEFDDAEELE